MVSLDIFGRKQKHRRLGRNNNKRQWWQSTPFLFLIVIVVVVASYTTLVVKVAVNNPSLINLNDKQLDSPRNGPNVRSSSQARDKLTNVKHPNENELKPNVVRLEVEGKDSEETLKRGPRGDKSKRAPRGQKSEGSPKGQNNQKPSPRGRKREDSPQTKKSDAVLVSGKMSEVIPPKPKVDIPKDQLNREVKRPGWMPNPKGHGVKPQLIVPGGGDGTEADKESEDEDDEGEHPDPEHVLKAFVEPIDFNEWDEKPLPVRKTASKDQLYELTYPKLNSCKKVPEKIPVDEYPDQDTFLPWVHDVFPTHDGKYIQFIAQNRRRCHTGNTPEEIEILHLTQPSVSLFQHVPVKRIKKEGETRYKLTSHEDADPDGVATRFICRFKPSMEETLSVFNFDYDYAAWRKKNIAHTFQYEDGGIKSVHLSQFIFRCPVPENLVETIASGKHVTDDWSSLFVDIIPIRTPPRYGFASEFLQPRYYDSLPTDEADRFDPEIEWGDNHILPRIEDSGRWENFPICRPSLQEYYSEADQSKAVSVPATEENAGNTEIAPKVHRLVACMWASAGYTTRGERFAINDGQRRMLEWIHFNKMLGFEHFYLYDNSYAFSNDVTLKPIADLFPGEITYIKWPFNVCNNNPNNVDSPGERSSQYAAESSCRLRFGPHVEWIGQFDIDEYLIPMGDYTSVLPILDKLEEQGKKILSFGSWRAWPRRDLIDEPVPIHDNRECHHNLPCFELTVPLNRTMLQTYNCDRQSGPKKDVMPAEKQLYRPDYVRQHFIHYSSVTTLSEMNKTEFEKAGYTWRGTRPFPDPNSRFSDEVNEATMLHTKAIARQDTAGWQKVCRTDRYNKGATCRIGVPYPDDYDETKHGEGDTRGWAYNCYINKKTENFWVPRLEKAMKEKHEHIFDTE